ncbi:hypothetical protein Tco_0453546 [Tanacetum coccineum]
MLQCRVVYKVEDIATYLIKYVKFWDEWEVDRYGNANLGILRNRFAGNVIAKWPTYSSDIDGFCNGGELPGMVQVRNMTYFQDHKWYDELADGKLKEETLMLKAKVKESWGNATPGVMKLCAWLINSFGNFHKLDYNVLVKLKEY